MTARGVHNRATFTLTAAVQVPLLHPTDVAGFHGEATRLLAQQVPPESVQWSAVSAQDVAEETLEGERASIRSRAARAIIPQSFVRMSELIVLHRDPLRFDLLYRSLWRLVYEPELKHDYSDHDLARLRQMAQSVRRDIQKMRTRLAFRKVQFKGHAVEVAWHEPSHFVAETVACELTRRKLPLPWVVLTPDRCLHWDGIHLLSAPGLPCGLQPHLVDGDDAWVAALATLPWG